MRPAARLNALDRAIGYFAPTWAKHRAVSRLALSSYQAGVERTGASNKGSLANWRPRLLSRYQEELQRKTLTQRARDLFANDANAASIINSMALSTTGYGLRPQSQPNLEALGVAEDDEARVEQVNAFARRAEMLFRNWSRFADADGRMSFGAFQFLAITRFYVDGEFFMLPVMQPHPRRKIDLAFQSLDSLRICSPRERQSSPNVKDGVLLGTGSSALGYFAANPKDGRLSSAYSEKDFKYIPARLGPPARHPARISPDRKRPGARGVHPGPCHGSFFQSLRLPGLRAFGRHPGGVFSGGHHQPERTGQ